MDISTQTKQSLITLPSELASRITIIDTNVGKAIQATEPIAKGTHLYPFAGKILSEPNMHTVQLDATRHILCVGGPEFTAHACDPNSYFMFVGDAVTLVSIKDIKRGELVSFNYCTTEWDMAEKFPCACKSPNCFGWIKGFKHCSDKQRQELMPYLSPFIRSKLLASAPVAALPTPAVATLSVSLPNEKSPERSTSTPSPTKEVLNASVSSVSPATSAPDSKESTPPRTPSPTNSTRKLAPSLSNAISSNALSVLSDEIRSRIEIVETAVGIGKAIQTTTFIPKGTHLYPCMGTISSQPDMWTVQLDATRHIMCLGGPAFTAHSCDPNAYFQFAGDSMTLVAIRDIQPLELVTFNYCTTEWDMSSPFECVCKSPNCFGAVRGYSHVANPKLRDLITPYLSPYIRSKALANALITKEQAKATFEAEMKSVVAAAAGLSLSPVSGTDVSVAGPMATAGLAPGASVPSNLYGSAAAVYRNDMVVNNSGVAVKAGGDATIAGHKD